jgi:hypothetical protein
MYTELHLNVELKRDTPDEVIGVLRAMVDGRAMVDDITGPDHPLFSTQRWRSMLRIDSAFFPADTRSTLRYDNFSKSFFLCIRCNLKNYDGEIEHFIDWISPYVEDEGFAGYSRYEEADDPTLIYIKDSHAQH